MSVGNCVSDLGEYKRNLSVLEKRLSEDCNDLATDLQAAFMWLDYALGPIVSEDQKRYFFQESFPKILKSALMRKYDPSHVNFVNILTFFETAISTIAEQLHVYPEGLSNALRDVLETNQPFYKKFCAQKENAHITQLQPQNQAYIANEKFLKNIAVGDAIDFRSTSQGRWQVGVVERFSDYKTEFEVSCESSANEWLSLERDASRIAEFGTKTGFSEPSAPPATVHAPEIVDGSQPNQQPVLEVGDGSWKRDLVIGDLVDARDKNNIWYQACILDIKKVESLSTVYNNDLVAAVATLATLSTSGSVQPSSATSCDMDLEGIYDTGENTPAGQHQMTNACVEMVVEEEEEVTTNVAVAEETNDSVDKNANGDAVSPIVEAVAVDENASSLPLPPVVASRTLVNIAFIGHPERSDEWIDLNDSSNRIQQLNTVSCGRRGDNPIREEVVFLVNLKPPSQQAEIDSYALYREGCFVEHQVIRLVNAFGIKGGFDTILKLLEPDSGVNILPLFSMVIAIGHVHRVLTKSFLASFGPRFLESVSSLLNRMTLSDMREVPVETLEQVFVAMENTAIAHLGRNAATGRIVEPLKLEIALRNLSGPFLNRRLGGLKILSELVRRADAAVDCPTGLRVTTTTSNNIETTSYRVVPITYHLSIKSICTQLIESQAILGIFEGPNAHESLMARASGIFCAIATQGLLSETLLSAIWTSGFVDRKAEALQLFSEVIPLLDPVSLQSIVTSIGQVPSQAVTINLVDTLAAISVRCRTILFENQNEYLSAIESSIVPTTAELKHVVSVYAMDDSLLRIIWSWLVDSSAASQTVLTRTMEKLETVLDYGLNQSSALRDPLFPWAMHWHRMKHLVETVTLCIKGATSVVHAIKVLQLIISAWPIRAVVGATQTVSNLQFGSPNRQNLVTCLNDKYDLLNAVADSVVQLKTSLMSEVHTKSLTNVDWSDAFKIRSESGNDIALPRTVQTEINQIRVNGSRICYTDQLEKTLDAIQMLLRQAEDMEFSQSAVSNIWQAVILQPLTSEEVDCVSIFFSRLVIPRALSAGNVMDLLNTTAAVTEKPRRNTVTSKETAEWIFSSLLTNTDSAEGSSFIRSPYFSIKTLQCCEKWFKWANSEAGLLVEAKTDKNSSATTFMITGDPHLLRGMELFPAVILSCVSDTVAAAAMKFFTTLPQYLSPQLKSSDMIVEFRNMFVERCVKELEAISLLAKGGGEGTSETGVDSSARLSRVLLLLDGILEESATNSAHRIIPHGTVSKGNKVVFKINSPSKTLKFKHAQGLTVSINVSDSVEDLLRLIAKELKTTVSGIKVFHRGKELGVSEQNKSIALLRRGCEDIAVDTLMVTERPVKHNKSPCTSPKVVEEKKQMVDLTTDSETGVATTVTVPVSRDVSTDILQLSRDVSQASVVMHEDPPVPTISSSIMSMPAWVLANSSDNFSLLFSLLKTSSAADCDRLWKLITRLPTVTDSLNSWLSLECDSVETLLMSFADPLQLNIVPELLYRLQIIEVLLQPAASQEEMDKNRDMIGEIDKKKLVSWASRFVEKGGFTALCKAFEWLKTQLSAFLSSETSPLGVTVHLLQCSFSLVTKLLRAFLVRISVSKDQRGAMPVLRAIKKKYDADNKPICGPVNQPSNSTTPVATVTADVSATNSPLVVEDDSTVVGAVMSFEWGWRLTATPADWERLHRLTDQVDVFRLQRELLLSAVLLRRLGHHEYFSTAKYLFDSNMRNQVLARQEAVLSSCRDLLAIWGCLGAVNGDILLHIRRIVGEEKEDVLSNSMIDCKQLLNELLLGGYKVSVVLDSYSEESKLSLSIGEWFSSALLSMMEWAPSFTYSQDGAIEGVVKPSETLCSEVFLSLLSYRPSLVDSVSYTSDSSTKPFTNASKFSPLFHLASSILEGLSPTSLSVISKETRMETCGAILSELIEAIRILRQHSTSRFLLLEGNIKLLSALPGGDIDILRTVFNSETIEFLLTDCLGIVSLEHSRDPILCTDESSRKHLYSIIYDACKNNITALRKLSKTLSLTHSQVPPPVAWSYRPDRDSRSATGFVGLKNLGSTCYMNSLLQILFMNQDIRKYLLSANLTVDQSEDVRRNDLLLQLKRMFYSLTHSERKAYTPHDWTYAFKDETGVVPINVMQQQDAQEFLQVLCERFEQCVANHNTRVDATYHLTDILHRTFGGKLCNQMFRSSIAASESSSDNGEQEIREQEESFVCISLEVKGSRGLEHSLERFVEGEQISDYQWREGSEQRDTITKRQCISELGDTLIFHLKRFELNFDTFLREKVNDKFPFPLRLDMRPYSKDGLKLGGGGSDETVTSGVHDAEYYEYELGGIVVHTGTTDSGHYFAYIKNTVDPNDSGTFVANETVAAKNNKWFEFNDSEVSEFNERQIEAECFGGSTSNADYNLTSNTMVFTDSVNPKNAYMLVYSRVKKLSPPIINVNQPAPSSAPQIVTNDDIVPAAVRVVTMDPNSDLEMTLEDNDENSDEDVKTNKSIVQVFDPIKEMKQVIDQENEQQALSLRVLSLHHMTFYKNVVDAIFQYTEQKSRPFSSDLMIQSYLFATRHVAHTSCVPLFVNFSAALIKYFDSYSKTGFPVVKSDKDSHVVSDSKGGIIDFSKDETTISKEAETATSNNEKVATVEEKEEVDVQEEDEEDSSTSSNIPPHHVLMHSLLKDFESVMSNLYSPTEEIRKEFAVLYLKLFKMTAITDGVTAFTQADRINTDGTGIDMRLGIITNAFVPSTNTPAVIPSSSSSAVSTTGHVMHTIPEGAGGESDDEELARAIAMSTGSEETVVTRSVTVLPAATSRPNSDRVNAVSGDKYELMAPRFLWELTMDSRMQQISEQWRKSGAHLWLLTEIAKSSWFARDFIVRRQVVSQIVDIILGDQCPLCGSIYIKGSRKRAPSSYVSVNVTKDGTLPASARNIPDWTQLIELLVVLVRGCYTLKDAPQYRPANATLSILDEWDVQCVSVKTLFSTLLRQPRYTKLTAPLVMQLAYNNNQFSDLMAEAVLEEIGLSPIENTAHIFDILEALLKIPDNFKQHRIATLFGPSQLNILETLKGVNNTPGKQRFVCVMLRSLLHFIGINPERNLILDHLARPHAKLNVWAPWVLKFLFRFQAKCNNEARESSEIANNQAQINQAIIASHAPASSPPVLALPVEGPPPPSVQKGQYLLVYGETEEERESTWVMRADKTFGLMQALLNSVNANIDSLMPEDAFEPESVAMQVDNMTDAELAAISTGANAMGPHNVIYDEKGNVINGSAGGADNSGIDALAAAGGAMTDEEFALFLESGKMDLN